MKLVTSRVSIKLMLAVLLFFNVSYSTAEVIQLTDENSTLGVIPFTAHLLDSQSSLTIKDILTQDVQNKFSPLKENIANFGFTSATVWLKLSYVDLRKSNSNNALILEIDFPILDYIELYRPSETGYQQYKTGMLEDYSTREITSNNFQFYLPSNDNITTVYLKIHSETPLIIPLNIKSVPYGLSERQLDFKSSYIFISIFFTMLLYNIFLSFTLKDKGHRYYIGWIFSVIFIAGFYHGLIQPYLGNHNVWVATHFWGIASSVGVFSVLFITDFLVLNERMSKWVILSRCIAALFMLNSLINFTTGYRLWTETFILIGLAAPFFLASIVYSTYLKQREGVIGLLAFSPIFFTIIPFALGSLNLIESSWWTLNGAFLGFALTSILLSISVGDKINNEKKKRYLLEKEIRQNLEVNNAALKNNNEVKDAFLSTISHELRTPLNGVLGSLSLLENSVVSIAKSHQSELSNEAANYTDLAHKSAQEMLDLINNIIGFTELYSGYAESFTRYFSPHCLTMSIIEAHKQSIASKGLTLYTNIESLNSIEIYSDEGQYKKALEILLSNAIKFTQEGSITISGSIKKHIDRNTQLVFSVNDTGIGIPEEKRKQILEPFLQADQTFSRQFGGLGIGMAVCKKIMDLQNGDIVITDNAGNGTCIELMFPLERFRISSEETTSFIDNPEIENETPTEATRYQSIQYHLKGKVLIVEDDSVSQLICADMIATFGLDLGQANNGQEALEALENEAFDLVFMDCQMPLMDGFEATQKIRGSEKAYRNIPIVAITANASIQDHNRCLEAGMNDFIAKPINLNTLRGVLGKFLGEKEQEERTSAESSSENVIAANDSGCARVLIVEDNLPNQMVTKAIVKKIGMEAIIAENGSLAVDIVKQGGIDFILMDCQMPVMDGFEATRKIRALEGISSVLPIIAVTANTSDEDKLKCQECGMDDFLAKPITYKILDLKLKEWVDKKSRLAS